MQDSALMLDAALALAGNGTAIHKCNQLLHILQRPNLALPILWYGQFKQPSFSGFRLLPQTEQTKEQSPVRLPDAAMQQLQVETFLRLAPADDTFSPLLADLQEEAANIWLFPIGASALLLWPVSKDESTPTDFGNFSRLLTKLEETIQAYHTNSTTPNPASPNWENEQYQLLVEGADDVIYKTDDKGHFTYINPMGLRVAGYEEERLLGQHFSVVIREDYKEAATFFYGQQFLNRDDTTYFEFPLISSTGNEIWMGQNVRLQKSTNDWVEGFTAVARDITERKKAQEELISTSSRLYTLIRSLHSGILVENEHREVVLANNRFCELFQVPVPADMLIGTPCEAAAEQSKQLFRDPEEFVEQVNRVLRNRKADIGTELHLKSGQVYLRDYIPIVSGTKFLGHLWQYKDVTESRNAQETIRRNEEKFRSVAENMQLALIEFNADDTIHKAAPLFTEITGYPSEELVGKKREAVLHTHPNDKAATERNVREVFVQRSENEIVWMLESHAPRYDQHGQPDGKIGIYFDITARKKMEQDLVEARYRAEESSRAKERFLANMSHEIRTPMNGITGMSQILHESGLTKEQLVYLNAIRTSADHLLVIINDILDISKIELSKLDHEVIGIDLRKLVEELFKSFEHKARDRNIDVQYVIEDEVAEVLMGDPVRINQILLNLVNNALKFTHEGSVHVHCKVKSETPDQQELQVEVTDTGIGIEAEKLDSIFNSFSQEDTSITRRYGGTGLGLSISKRLIELFGGEISVESEKGKGTTFRFNLVLEKGGKDDLPKPTNLPQTDERLKGKRALLAEDHDINIFLTTTILERWGIETEIALNGREAVKMARKNPYDIILMDMQMPIMSGIKATTLIREELKSTVPILALTANAQPADNERCLKAGMNDYISKPFKPEELFSKIAVLVGAGMLEEQPLIPNSNSMISTVNGTHLYNLDKLREMAGNDQDFIQKMVDMFLTQAPDMLAKISEHLNNEDYKKLRDIAHKMKPSLDFMGISSLHAEIRKIEKYAEARSNLSELPGLVQLLKQTTETVCDQLRQEFK